MLQIENLEVRYGNIIAVHDVSFQVDDGQIVCLVGSNGAGKTTTMNALSGLLRASRGSIKLDGEELVGKPPHLIARKGLIPVPEGRKIFARLTVKDNLIMGGYAVKDKTLQKQRMEMVTALFPELTSRMKQFGGTLSGGEQQMLAIGRALMAGPKVLLMDEPSMGLAPIVVDRIFETIRKIKEEGVTIFLVEQNANKALGVADYGYVVERGRVVLQDTGSELLKNENVTRAYMGANTEDA